MPFHSGRERAEIGGQQIMRMCVKRRLITSAALQGPAQLGFVIAGEKPITAFVAFGRVRPEQGFERGAQTGIVIGGYGASLAQASLQPGFFCTPQDASNAGSASLI